MQKKSDNPKSAINAREYVYRLLNYRLYSEHEIREKMDRKHFSLTDINQTISYFKELDLVNDRLFAKKWISSRQSKPYGRDRIRFELKQKGIKDDVLKEELSVAFTDFSEEEVVCQLIRKQAAKYREIEPAKRKKRVYGYLIRRGFDNRTIMKALNQYDDNQ